MSRRTEGITECALFPKNRMDLEMSLTADRQREVAIDLAGELNSIEISAEPDRGYLFAPAPGSPRIFIDNLIDTIIASESSTWPAILKGLQLASLIIPVLKPVVVILNTVPADKIVEILKQVRTLI